VERRTKAEADEIAFEQRQIDGTDHGTHRLEPRAGDVRGDGRICGRPIVLSEDGEHGRETVITGLRQARSREIHPAIYRHPVEPEAESFEGSGDLA
jgi:hypothetical protein